MWPSIMKWSKLCVIVIFCGALIACTSEDEHAATSHSFVPGGIHASTIDYMDEFEVYSGMLEELSVHIEDTVYSDSLASDLCVAIENDLQALHQIGVFLNENEIYIVESLKHSEMLFTGTRFYCTADQILSGEYRRMLVDSFTDFDYKEIWKLYGYTGYIFHEWPDDSGLAEFYSREENLDVLSLFVAYFHEDFTSDQELEIAHNTAVSLTKYVIDEFGSATFFNSDCNSCKQAWLNSIGLEVSYDDPYFQTLNAYTYTQHDYYSFKIETDNGVILYCEPLAGDMDTPLELREFLYDIHIGMEEILSILKHEVPESFPSLLENLEDPINLYFDGKEQSYTTRSGRQIHLNHSAAFFHEIFHLLIPTTFDGESWRNEGICNYLNWRYYQSNSQKELYYTILINAYSASDMQFEVGSYESLYVDTAINFDLTEGIPAEYSDLDLYAYFRVMAQVQTAYIENGMENLPAVSPVYAWATGTIKRNEGNELTDIQATYFTEYLICNYSLDVFLNSCINKVPFEDAFGVTYDTAKQAWLNEFISPDIKLLLSD